MTLPGSFASIVPPGEDAVPKQLADLDRRLRELGPSIAESFAPVILDLQMQQAALAAAVADIAAQQAAILDLVNTQIVPAAALGSGGGYSIPAGVGSRVVRATATLTVPAGYTQALVSADVSDTGVNSTAGFDYVVSYVQIAGGSLAYGNSATIPPGHTGVSFAAITQLLTGLTGGSTISVTSAPYTNTGAFAAHAANSTIVSATCLFLR